VDLCSTLLPPETHTQKLRVQHTPHTDSSALFSALLPCHALLQKAGRKSGQKTQQGTAKKRYLAAGKLWPRQFEISCGAWQRVLHATVATDICPVQNLLVQDRCNAHHALLPWGSASHKACCLHQAPHPGCAGTQAATCCSHTLPSELAPLTATLQYQAMPLKPHLTPTSSCPSPYGLTVPSCTCRSWGRARTHPPVGGWGCRHQ